MEVQFNSSLEQVIKEKILSGIEPPYQSFTRRNITLPKIKGKAIAVIGMRRAGKTTFLQQCRTDLIEGGRRPEKLLYFNFEDERLFDLQAQQLKLIPEIHERLFPNNEKEPVTLFLDEIQRISGWEGFVRRLLDTPGYELFLSGSSAKLLSREIATSMRGRAWEIAIYPFSFAEFLSYHKKEVPEKIDHLSFKKQLALDHQFALFLKLGGLPEAQSLNTAERRQLLQGYVDVLLLRDVIERHQIVNVVALRWMVRRLMSNPAGLFSVTKFAADLKSQGIAASRDTLYELLDHLQDTFLLKAITIAGDSEKRRQVNLRKIYPADTGFISVFDRSEKSNIGHALENAVFVELQRRNADVTYVNNSTGTEVDFLARYDNNTEELTQVCASLDSPETLQREIRALEDAHKIYPHARQLILTLESKMPFPSVPKKIQIMPAWQWMLKSR
ncbi:MAG: ATP-binding protein [Chthoniobacterales bacterium]